MSSTMLETMDGSNCHFNDSEEAPALVQSSPVRGASGGAPRRDSIIELEGVEYDLSNLLVDSSKTNNDDDCSTSSYASNDDENTTSTSGFMSCRSKGTRGTARSRGTMSRNVSNASTIFELPDKTLFDKNKNERRDSPYRFDLAAMRTLMTSFRGVPELQHSFRLTKSGSIRHLDSSLHDLSDSSANNNNNIEDDNDNDDLPLQAKKNQDEDDDAVFLKLDSDIAAEVYACNESGKTVETTGSNTEFDPATRQEEEKEEEQAPAQNQQPYEDEDGIDDLVFDEATGTYVYRDYEYTYPGQPEPQPVDYHEPCETNTEHCRRFTLEEMTMNAALGADNEDQEGSAFDDEECEMEISPGIYVPFRGAKETWQAVATHTTHELECFDCGLVLVCINDCEFTVCPDCRVVNPVFCEDPVGKPFGVGMGFNKQWVLKKQQQQQQQQRIVE